MAKPLVIVESKAKARTIEGFLGRDRFTVMASVGHVRDLPHGAREVPKNVTDPDVRRLGIDVQRHFAPIYVVPAAKRTVVSDLRKAMRDASELYLATDEDREGEAISWHLLEVLSPPPNLPVRRMVFHEITRSAIEEALGNWRELDMKLVEAQEGRRVLDRLVGYEVSPVVMRRVAPGTSAGRVQSVATRLIVERERMRMAFRAARYWDLEATFRASANGDGSAADFPGTLVALDGKRLATGRDFDPATGRITADAEVVQLDEAAASALAAALHDRPFTVTAVEARSMSERPKPPFITSTLQQEAARKLGFSAGRAMAVAQVLYERGYITYMRTDSTTLSSQAINSARAQVRALYGSEFLPDEPRVYQSKVKNAQEAHEAIRPAGDAMRTTEQVSSELNRDERRLYDLIWKRTIASQMADARIRRVIARLAARTAPDGEGTAREATFQATGRTIEFPGYLRAYVEGADDPDAEFEDRESVLPPLDEGDDVACTDLRVAGHTTQPPARYTEASLVKELEERGIGRPSTYASVIDTIVNKRDYVWKKGQALVPSWIAFAKIQLLERYFGHLVDYEFTATMEEALDSIARGESEAEKWLHSFYFGDGDPGLKQLVSEEHLATIDMADVNRVHFGVDPQGREVWVRVWRNGANVERADAAALAAAASSDDVEIEKAPIPADLAPDELTFETVDELIARGAGGPRVLGVDPATNLRVLALTGRYGPFVQLGEQVEGSKDKPKRASLFSTMSLDSVSLEEALALLALPRVVGATNGQEITAQNGRFGPYLKRGDETRSLDTEEQLLTVTLAEAEALFAAPKRRRAQGSRAPIAELGPHPESGVPVRVLDGRYGPYVTDGTTNATVPRGVDPAEVTLDHAIDLLAERAARVAAGGGAARTKRTAKRVTKRTSTTKRTVAKKTTARKSATRSASPKKSTKPGSAPPTTEQ